MPIFSETTFHFSSATHHALLAWNNNDYAATLAHLQQAYADNAHSLVLREGITYVQRVLREGKQNVYVSPQAFGAFIRGGGNVPLYANTSAALQQAYAQHNVHSLLDIGVGDGLALLPALAHAPSVRWVDVVEPSAAMLNNTERELNRMGAGHRVFNETLAQFMQRPLAHWDLAQATYSLQSIVPQERATVFAWLRTHAQRVCMVEFDAPDFTEMFSPERVNYVLNAYEKGLAEYEGDDGLVAQGFLLPVFFGNFDGSAARTNWEIPIDRWMDLLRTGGFAHVRKTLVYRYWWADAYLIEAS